MSGIIGSVGSKSGVIGPHTSPDTPAFWVYSASVANIGTGYTTIPLNNEIYDIFSNFNTSTYTFTAPVTGIYHFDCHAKFEDLQDNIAYLNMNLFFTYANMTDQSPFAQLSTTHFDSDTDYFTLHHISNDSKMDAGDTLLVKIYRSGGDTATDLTGNGTYLSGHLIR